VKFTQLRLAGFKSFVDPTDMRIDPGLTGVIGPNGCGKSNLLEALRWVMGATSAKSLRGGGMDDVIFAGTDVRPSRNHAEVTLTVDNSEKLAPARFNDSAMLEVSRRINRGAGSTYKINGEEVRAKDVQLLFADAGTGANSPALVRQGQISELIAAKPENRRRVLEEAAGVSGLRARRHEAELRLKGAETNLDRLQEIIDETATRYGALQRQARQASRYRKLSASIRTLEAAVWLNRWRDAKQGVESGDTALKDQSEIADSATRAAAEARTKAEVLAAGREPARLAEAEASAGLRRLEREREILERDAADVQRSIQEIEHRLSELATASTREQAIVEDARSSCDATTADLKTIDEKIAREKNLLAGAEAAAADAEDGRRSKEAVLDAKAREVANRRATLEAADRDRNQLIAQLDRRTPELETALSERDQLAGSDRLKDVEAANDAVTEAEKALKATRTAHEQAENKRRSAEALYQETSDTLRQLTVESQALDREIEALERILASSMEEDSLPALNSVRARPGYEHALAAALGDDLDASLDENAARHWSETNCQAGDLPGGSVPLSDHVEGPAALKARLDAVGVIKPEKAAAAVKKLKPGQKLVTREGDVWRWDGLVESADAPSPAVARLEQRNRLDEIRLELNQRAQALEEASAKNSGSQAELETCKTNEFEAKALTGPAETAARSALEARSALREDAAKDAARITALDETINRLHDEIEIAQKSLKLVNKTIDASVDEAPVDNGLDDARTDVNAARLAAADARASLESVRRESELRRQRRASIQRDQDAWTERRDTAEAHIKTIKQQTENSTKQLAEAHARPEQLQSRLHALTDKLEAATAVAERAREEASSTEDQVKTADTAARAAEAAASSAREARAATEARLNAANERLAETTARLQDATGTAPGALAQQIADENAINEMSVEDLEHRLDETRQSRERLGAVNLRAEEEASELATKQAEMTQERDDLLAAIDRLRKAVEQLSREGRVRLLEAFEIVDGHFKALFATLFEGGEAELRLTEHDDPLEAGLEIFACPPGKRMETMSLMSGGEQALTASALIFAVFLSNPAPVCVLDEVDAPLDDSNVDRYCRMLDEMRRLTETRFLVITHNPLTMSRVDRLYGVTMAERGVSQLVSVDLVAAEQLVAAE
jgi:chromosome segregation protein